MSLTDKHSGCADPANCSGCVTAPGTKYEGHTPGPWKIRHDSDAATILAQNAAVDYLVVAKLPHDYTHEDKEGLAALYADARLLCDAPKLLGWNLAARDVLARIEDSTAWYDLNATERDDIRELLDLTRPRLSPV